MTVVPNQLSSCGCCIDETTHRLTKPRNDPANFPVLERAKFAITNDVSRQVAEKHKVMGAAIDFDERRGVSSERPAHTRYRKGWISQSNMFEYVRLAANDGRGFVCVAQLEYPGRATCFLYAEVLIALSFERLPIAGNSVGLPGDVLKHAEPV
jgi:hypothetical protein